MTSPLASGKLNEIRYSSVPRPTFIALLIGEESETEKLILTSQEV